MKRFSLFLLIVLLTTNFTKYTLEAKNILNTPESEPIKKEEVTIDLKVIDGWVDLGNHLKMDEMGIYQGMINNNSVIVYEDFKDHLFLNGLYKNTEVKFKKGSPRIKINDVEKYFKLKHKEEDTFVILKENDSNKSCVRGLNQKEVIKKLEGMTQPIDNSIITENPGQMPGAPREYRNGYHEGFDWYSGAIGREINENTNVYPMYEGKIVKIDHEYEELDYDIREEMLAEAQDLNRTPQKTLDMLRGRQVWIESDNNVLVRYAHLSSVNEDLQVGDVVGVETKIGTTGNSGTSQGALETDGDIHLHTDILVCGLNFWQYGDIDELVGELVVLYKNELEENKITRDPVEDFIQEEENNVEQDMQEIDSLENQEEEEVYHHDLEVEQTPPLNQDQKTDNQTTEDEQVEQQETEEDETDEMEDDFDENEVEQIESVG